MLKYAASIKNGQIPHMKVKVLGFTRAVLGLDCKVVISCHISGRCKYLAAQRRVSVSP